MEEVPEALSSPNQTLVYRLMEQRMDVIPITEDPR